mmetsp:Transcript_132320/g.411311  ORF Transcript_132320/g.411311 Transcript_132320/m.411311 type:complete len:271 (-) Transcript_132320:256-1068(-)
MPMPARLPAYKRDVAESENPVANRTALGLRCVYIFTVNGDDDGGRLREAWAAVSDDDHRLSLGAGARHGQGPRQPRDVLQERGRQEHRQRRVARRRDALAPLLGHREEAGIRLPDLHIGRREGEVPMLAPCPRGVGRDGPRGLAEAIVVIQVDADLDACAGIGGLLHVPLPVVAVHAVRLAALHRALEQALHELDRRQALQLLIDAAGDGGQGLRQHRWHVERRPLGGGIHDDGEVAAADVERWVADHAKHVHVQRVGVEVEGDLRRQVD